MKPAVPKIPCNCKSKKSQASSARKSLMQISGIYYFRCWLGLAGSQTSQETLQGSVSLTGKGLLDPESRLEKVYTKEHLLSQCLCNSWQYEKTTEMFLFCPPKLEVSAFICCLQTISSLSTFGAKGPHKHSFWRKIEVFKVRLFCRTKYSNELRGSSNYTGVNTIKTTLLSRQGSTIYPSQLFHRIQRTTLHYIEDNGRGFSNLKVNLD